MISIQMMRIYCCHEQSGFFFFTDVDSGSLRHTLGLGIGPANCQSLRGPYRYLPTLVEMECHVSFSRLCAFYKVHELSCCTYYSRVCSIINRFVCVTDYLFQVGFIQHRDSLSMSSLCSLAVLMVLADATLATTIPNFH